MTEPKLTRHTCYTLACSDCDDDSWDEFTPHFPTKDALWAALLGKDGYGWTRRPDGRALCRRCSDRADCAKCGHQLTPWSPLPRDPDIQWRHCQHCGGALEDRLHRTRWPVMATSTTRATPTDADAPRPRLTDASPRRSTDMVTTNTPAPASTSVDQVRIDEQVRIAACHMYDADMLTAPRSAVQNRRTWRRHDEGDARARRGRAGRATRFRRGS